VSRGIAVEMRPFFPFKNRPLQSYGPWSSSSVDVKTRFSDLADFALINSESNWLRTSKILSRLRNWTKRSGSNRTWISITIVDLGTPYIYFCNIPNCTHWSLFSTVASLAPFSAICQILVSIGLRKMWCYKVVAFHLKTSPRTLAARRLYCDMTQRNRNWNPCCSKIRRIMRILFLHLWVRYFSMDSSDPPSRDSVPLKTVYCTYSVVLKCLME
jgi:hypothetical protein